MQSSSSSLVLNQGLSGASPDADANFMNVTLMEYGHAPSARFYACRVCGYKTSEKLAKYTVTLWRDCPNCVAKRQQHGTMELVPRSWMSEPVRTEALALASKLIDS